MKYIAIAISALVLTACSMNIGAGYRKTPMISDPVQPAPLTLSPSQIDTIISIIGNENFAKIAEFALPKDEQVTLGGWIDIEIR